MENTMPKVREAAFCVLRYNPSFPCSEIPLKSELVVPVLKRLRPEDVMLEACLVCIVRSSLQTTAATQIRGGNLSKYALDVPKLLLIKSASL